MLAGPKLILSILALYFVGTKFLKLRSFAVFDLAFLSGIFLGILPGILVASAGKYLTAGVAMTNIYLFLILSLVKEKRTFLESEVAGNRILMAKEFSQ